MCKIFNICPSIWSKSQCLDLPVLLPLTTKPTPLSSASLYPHPALKYLKWQVGKQSQVSYNIVSMRDGDTATLSCNGWEIVKCGKNEQHKHKMLTIIHFFKSSKTCFIRVSILDTEKWNYLSFIRVYNQPNQGCPEVFGHLDH